MRVCVRVCHRYTASAPAERYFYHPLVCVYVRVLPSHPHDYRRCDQQLLDPETTDTFETHGALPFLVLIGSRVSFRAKLDRLRPRSRSLAACTHEDRPHSDNALAVRLEWTTAILITDLASSRESEPTRSRLPVRAQGEITATPVMKQLARAPTDCKRETVDKVRGKT